MDTRVDAVDLVDGDVDESLLAADVDDAFFYGDEAGVLAHDAVLEAEIFDFGDVGRFFG